MQVSVARRNLFSDRVRLAISIGGVAVAILLILTLLGVYKGTLDQSTAYVSHVDADVWVAQAGALDMFHTFSILPLSLAEELATIDGVTEVHPLVARSTAIEIKGKSNSIRVVGFHPGSAGGPWEIAEGRGDPGPGEIVADQVTMKKNDLKLGDSIEVEGRPHRIVGVSRGTSDLIFEYAFVNIEETRAFLGPERVNFLLLKTDPTQRELVMQEIAALHPETAVFARERFAENNAAVIRESFLPILLVLVVYTATVERSREYGILKAVGASAGRLYRIVFQQSVLSSLMGYLVGAALTWGVAALVGRLVSQINISFSWLHFAGALAAALVMSLVAAAVPIRKINSIDPMIVFKA